MIARRSLIAAVVALAPGAAFATDPHVWDMEVRRNPGCGCCNLWADHLRASSMFRVTIADEADMGAYRRGLGVPNDLTSCHTGLVQGYAIEGHVPVADVLRLLRERPRGVRGLAVPGMPIGSPGMEGLGGRREAYEVIAFHADGTRSVWTSYEAT